ncbi:MAG: hypothetical protein M1285_05495 [Candidatus Thermoplasmatota archaeon]|nr:hypothetical protein [Candidatus Thermoplasmatota archaeon]
MKVELIRLGINNRRYFTVVEECCGYIHNGTEVMQNANSTDFWLGATSALNYCPYCGGKTEVIK